MRIAVQSIILFAFVGCNPANKSDSTSSGTETDLSAIEGDEPEDVEIEGDGKDDNRVIGGVDIANDVTGSYLWKEPAGIYPASNAVLVLPKTSARNNSTVSNLKITVPIDVTSYDGELELLAITYNSSTRKVRIIEPTEKTDSSMTFEPTEFGAYQVAVVDDSKPVNTEKGYDSTALFPTGTFNAGQKACKTARAMDNGFRFHRVFVSLYAENGNMGTTTGAKSLCAQYAANAGLTSAWGEWDAVISGLDDNAVDRLAICGAIYNDLSDGRNP